MMAGGFQGNGVKAPPTHIRSEHSKTNKVRFAHVQKLSRTESSQEKREKEKERFVMDTFCTFLPFADYVNRKRH